MSQYVDMSPHRPSTDPLLMTCPRLRWREVRWVLTIALMTWLVAPRLANRIVVPELAQRDYRTPYDASQDYWRFGQLARQATDAQQILVLGDSVIWGEYVPAEAALTAQLNDALGRQKFVNGGINGMHPLALSGLVSDYARSLRQQPVLVHCNLLWLTSAERDLSADSDLSFNHPRLIPQFTWRIPSYKADVSERLSVVVERHTLMRQWVRHLWIRYLGGQDVPHWTLEHPYQWPAAVTEGDWSATRQSPVAWTERGIRPQSYSWVELDQSLQWRAFQETIGTLQRRGNRVFVLVGPFNTHLLTEASRAAWQARRTAVVAWLQDHDIAHLAPDPLPSEMLADASHPLAAGYHRLAAQLLADPSFQAWLPAAPK